VEAVFEGDEAAVARMVGWARTGPRHAQVTTLEVLDEEPRGETGFDIRF
jgi:acylphosphatase